ncbi:MAG TPA: acyl carrier protein [Polyangiales bacterium]|nr:acyl carrier protein [Polyangiales bacterium]
MSKQVNEKVRAIIAEQLGVNADGFKDDASFIDDLGADSLAVVELVLALEENFSISIPDTETQNIRTVADAVSYIEQHAAA